MPEYLPIGLYQQEPNVPEWAGRYPIPYGLAGATYETMDYIPGMSGLRAGLGEKIGYPLPKVTSEMAGQEAMDLGVPAMSWFKKAAAPIAKPQIWVRQKGDQFVAQTGGFGAEGRMVTSGKTLEETMSKAKAMSPGHDIKILRETQQPLVKASRQALPTAEQRADYGLREKVQKLKDEGDVEQLHKLIYEDPLTGVLNKRAFDEVAPLAAQQGKNFASMDASGLKYINDTYGHEAGDTFLKEYTKALKDEGVDLYRTGGDEMVAIFGKGDYGKLKRATHNFSAKEIPVKDLKGNPVTLKGAKFDFGVGKTFESGDAALLKKRVGLEATGQRAGRGEKPVGLTEFTKGEALAELKRRRQQ